MLTATITHTELPSVNGVCLVEPEAKVAALDQHTLAERLLTELLRQRAATLGYLPPSTETVAPELDLTMQARIEQMLEDEIKGPNDIDEATCLRYHQTHPHAIGQNCELKHILFAVTPGVPVLALTQMAQTLLDQLKACDAIDLAHQWSAEVQRYSNCPSAAQDGNLGSLSKEDLAPEIAQVLFKPTTLPGLYPQLVFSRFGIHIFYVSSINKGRTLDLAESLPAIRLKLMRQTEFNSLSNYLSQLLQSAEIKGVEIEWLSNSSV